MAEQEERARVVETARGWLGTPYRHHGAVKGAGADCAMLPLRVFVEAGLIEPFDVPHYPPDWHLHRSAERYLEIVMRHAREVEGPPLPGDLVLWRFGRCFAHGAIVTAWPKVIHAYIGRGVVEDDAEASTFLCSVTEIRAERGKPRPRRFFSIWG